MKINYWDCKYSDFDDGWDGVEENPTYGCTHPFGVKDCPVENKWGKEDCVLLDIKLPVKKQRTK